MTTFTILLAICFGPALVLGLLARSVAVFTIVMIGAGFYLCKSDTDRRTVICVEKTVTSIGGCNRAGYCRVGNSDGSEGYAEFPLVDRKSQECHTEVGPVWWDRSTK